MCYQPACSIFKVAASRASRLDKTSAPRQVPAKTAEQRSTITKKKTTKVTTLMSYMGHTKGGLSAVTAAARLGQRTALVVVFRAPSNKMDGASMLLRSEEYITRARHDAMDGVDFCLPYVEELQRLWRGRSEGMKAPNSRPLKDRIEIALNRGWEVWLTGHGMGGAVAQTATALLVCGHSSRIHMDHLPSLSVVTFNAPNALSAEDSRRYDRARRSYDVEYLRVDDDGNIVRSLTRELSMRDADSGGSRQGSLLAVLDRSTSVQELWSEVSDFCRRVTGLRDFSD